MGALLDLWKSERGLVLVALIVAVTTLCGLGYVSPTQWLDYTKWIFAAYVAGKTITGSVQLATSTPDDQPTWADKLKAMGDIIASLERRSSPPDPPPPTVAPPRMPTQPAQEGATPL